MNGSNERTRCELRLNADHLSLRQIGPWLASLLDDLEPVDSGAALTPVELAVHELATNSVDHAESVDGELVLSGYREGSNLFIELTDRGRPIERSSITVPDPDRPQVRGYGLMIAEQLTAALDYERTGDVNRWIARFEIDGAVAQAISDRGR